MEAKQYLLTDDRVEFCFGRLRSFKISRVISPFAYLFINYFFIFALFRVSTYNTTFIIYLIFSIITTIATFLITNKAINRYRNVIKQIKIYENGTFKIHTLLGNTIVINKNEYIIVTDTLTVNRYNKFKVYIIVFNKEKFSIVVDWFDNHNEIRHFFDNYSRE